MTDLSMAYGLMTDSLAHDVINPQVSKPAVVSAPPIKQQQQQQKQQKAVVVQKHQHHHSHSNVRGSSMFAAVIIALSIHLFFKKFIKHLADNDKKVELILSIIYPVFIGFILWLFLLHGKPTSRV